MLTTKQRDLTNFARMASAVFNDKIPRYDCARDSIKYLDMIMRAKTEDGQNLGEYLIRKDYDQKGLNISEISKDSYVDLAVALINARDIIFELLRKTNCFTLFQQAVSTGKLSRRPDKLILSTQLHSEENFVVAMSLALKELAELLGDIFTEYWDRL